MQRAVNLNSCSSNRNIIHNEQAINNYAPAARCTHETNINTRKTWGLTDYPLASVYAPIQEFDGLYDCEHALMRGTIFKQLDLPFHGASIARGGN